MNEPLHQKEARLLKAYHLALDERRNYDAKVLYAQLLDVRIEIKKLTK